MSTTGTIGSSVGLQSLTGTMGSSVGLQSMSGTMSSTGHSSISRSAPVTPSHISNHYSSLDSLQSGHGDLSSLGISSGEYCYENLLFITSLFIKYNILNKK